MAWTTIGTTNVVQTSATLGYVYLQYNTASSGSTWAVRLITGARSGGYSFNVRFDNVTVDGNNQGSKSNVTQNSVVVWSGNLSGGRSISGSWSCSWTTGTKYYSISGTLPAKGSAPSGGYITFNSHTWDSVNLTAGVSSWNGLNGTLSALIVTGEHNGDANSVTSLPDHARREYWYGATSNLSHTFTATDDATSGVWYGTPLSIKGLLHYKIAYRNVNSAGSIEGLDTTLRYLPPSPPAINYTNVTTSGTKTYPVTFTGDPNFNHTTYDTDELTRYVRYKIDDGSWIVVENNTVKTIDAVSRFNVTIPPSSKATVEGYMTYHGQKSETVTVVITNSSNPKARIYGSVNNTSERLAPLYGTFSNYFDGRHVVSGREQYVSTDILGDSITATRVASGSGGYTWVPFLVDATDEIINKQVTLSGELLTSGNFTSGARLWWMNSANTGILSGPVAGIEYIGNSGKFSVSGTIPARPSSAGKLALLLYSNIASAAQGVYTVYNNVELKANVKNMFNYLSPRSIGGLTTTLAADGTLTVTGVLSANYQAIVQHIIITDLLEDGVEYTLSAANGATADMCLELRGRKTGTTTYSYWNTRGSSSTTVTIDKTTYDQYAVCVVTSTTASWGTESKTVSNKFQLEKGASATSFAPYVDTKAHKILRLYAPKNGRSKLIYDDSYQ